MRIVRLGEGVDRTGRLSERPWTAHNRAARDARMIAEGGPWRSDGRDERHPRRGERPGFTGQVRDILGIEPEVISGEEEAWLSFTGATRELAGTGLAGTARRRTW